MTTTADTLTAFLKSDLTNIAQAPTASDIYVGQGARTPRGRFEVWIHHRDPRPVRGTTGDQELHRIDLEVYRGGLDASEERELSLEVRTLADAIVDRYDGARGGRSILAAGLTSLAIERVRCERRELQTQDDPAGRMISVELQVWLWR